MQRKAEESAVRGADTETAEGRAVAEEAVLAESLPGEAAEADCGLEDLFAQAEALIAKLENPELPLEEAFAAYEQGMKVIARCNGKIDAVEKKMLMMNEEGALVPFTVSGGQ